MNEILHIPGPGTTRMMGETKYGASSSTLLYSTALSRGSKRRV